MGALSYAEPYRLSRQQTLLGGIALTPPSSYDLGLFTGDPNNGGVECTGTGYARLTGITNDTTNFVVIPGTLSKSYRSGIDWQWSAAAGAGWGTPNWVCFFVASTSTKVFAAQLDNATPIATGDPVRILAGEAVFQTLN